MTSTLIVFSGLAVLLLAALIWALRAPSRMSRGNFDLSSLEQSGRRHATYLSLIRRASSSDDLAFLSKRGYAKLQSRLHRERRKVVLLYLDQLRCDFERLTKMARAVAALSPSVGVRQEFERAQLSFEFLARYYAIRLAFGWGFVPIAQLSQLSQLVSELSIQMETSMKEFGERAAMAVQGASSPFDGNGAGVA
ncbi:MAG TPA: hypothetical protein VH022_13380 [Candidatus Acidoferrum sp.]|nr:hypothetical protein [Candidatus Acidoferrum sp.]